MTLVTAIAIVLLAWVAVGASCIGWGSRLIGLMSSPGPGNPSLAARFWAGFSALLGLLQVWHLFLPVNGCATLVLLGAGWLALYRTGSGQAARAALPAGGGRIILLLLALWLAYRGLDYPRNYDSGLYHFSSIRWANEFPAVPGLANLHDRLGFNQSFFLYAAFLNVHPFTNEGYHVANSLLFFVLVVQLLERVRHLTDASGPVLSSWLACLLLPVTVWGAGRGELSSPTPDLAVFAVGVASFLIAVRGREGVGTDFAALPALLAAGCTLKLSFAVYGFTLALGLIFAGAAPGARRRVELFALCALAWGLPYAIHGIILSGYPAFPSTAVSWPVDWRLPREEAQSAADWILAWGRTPGSPPAAVLSSWAWLAPWWHRLGAETAIPVALAIGTACTLALLLRSTSLRPARQEVLTLFGPLAAALLFWFFSAPDPRFADWLIWLATAWLVATTLVGMRPPLSATLRRALTSLSVGATFIFALLAPGLTQQPRRFGWHSFHRVEVRTYETLSGLRIIVPAPGADPRLWDAPLPATPYEKPTLELRGPGLREGFRTRTP